MTPSPQVAERPPVAIAAGGSDGAAAASVLRHGLVIAAASGVYLWSITRVDAAHMTDMGIISVLPIAVYAALIVMIAGFATAARVDLTGRVQGAYVLGLTVMLHGMPPLAYEFLRFSWAWKHVGIVDYIQRFGDVDPGIASLPVYHNWPGFFGLNAWITESSRLESALSYASWSPILFNLLFVGALYVMFRGFTTDRRLIWTSLLLFVLGNWVGQDYFAPQALAFFLYLLVLAILLRWYPQDPGYLDDGAVRPAGDVVAPGSVASVALSGVVVAGLFVIASSHPLTPVMTVVALAALVVSRVIRVRWPVVVIAVLTTVWALGPAREFVFANLIEAAREAGGFQVNVDSNLVDFEIVSPAQEIISLVARGLSAALLGLGALGWLRRRRRGVRSGWVSLLAAVPALLVMLSSYGGEVIFRAYLFALPFVAYLAASLWFADETVGRRLLARWTLGATIVVLTAALLIADFGADRRQVFSADEVAAANFVFENAREGALIIEGTRDYPRQHRNYEKFVFLPLDRSTPDTLRGLMADPAERLASWLSDDDRYNGGYVIITESQRNTVSDLGTLLEPTLDAIEESLLTSELFEVVYESGTARVFALTEEVS